MNIKLFEIRDRDTFIPVFAFMAASGESYLRTEQSDKERYLMLRCGYCDDPLFIVGQLDDDYCTYNYEAWENRTMGTAHKYIQGHWEELNSGDVIDVEYILGETLIPKLSERLD